MTDAARRMRHYPWAMVAMLWFASFLNAADRSILVATMPQIRDDFGLSATQLALVNSLFFWVYAVAAFLSGRVGDTVRRSRLIAYGLVFWSVATGSMALASGFAMLLGIRAAVAIGESTYYPSATALISDWHRPAQRSKALSFHQTGLFAGAGLGAIAAGFIADRLSWHAPFLVFAVIGILWALFLAKFLADAPAAAPAPSTTAATDAAVERRDPLGVVIRTPAALILCAVFFLANGASTGVMVWAPTYAHDLLGLNLAGSALLGSATINAAGFVSVPLGGILADALAKRSPIGRFYTLAIGLFLAGLCLIPILGAKSATMVAAILIASSIGKGLFDGCIYAAMHDIMPARARASAVGLMTTLGFIGGGLSPILVARIGDQVSLGAGMAALAIAYALAVAIILGTRPVIRAATLAGDNPA
jgi:MFS family permease